MPHELHQRRQTDAATEHVGREGVSKPVRIRLRHVGDAAVRRRPSRKDGEGFATRAAETAPYPDPVVVFVVGLLAPLAVADDGVESAARAASWQQHQRERV